MPLTTAENTNFERTGSYHEVVEHCYAFARAYPRKLACQSLGQTPEGRQMMALVYSHDGVLTPTRAHSLKKIVVYLQAGIHAGEMDGKEAGFIFLRQLLSGKVLSFKNVVLVFVPVLNVDGHERFRAYQRPNQNGPLETGWRVTGMNLNLNRDHLKAEDPHMKMLLRFLKNWRPHLTADLHVTDGAQFEHEIAYIVEPYKEGYAPLIRATQDMEEYLLHEVSKKGFSPLNFYPSFIEYENPLSGVEREISTPRFAQGLARVKNRIGILVETHSWKPRTRVTATLESLMALTELQTKMPSD